jgi:3-isopropylmalate/(R)-2-methylmalate dehydratase large subunit
MGKTVSEKILESHCREGEIFPGQLIQVRIDKLMSNDISFPMAISEFKKLGATEVFDPEKIFIILDHLAPARDILSAENNRNIREFAKTFGITNVFDIGRSGIEHVFLPEMGFILPGDLVIGGDSHTCTYGAMGAFSTGMGSTDLAYCMAFGETWLKVPKSTKYVFSGQLLRWVGGKDLILFLIGQIGVEGALYRSMEITGDTIRSLPMADRFTFCNMAAEAGAKNAIIEPDEKTLTFMHSLGIHNYPEYKSDKEAVYDNILEFEVSKLRPQVACPSSPDNVKAVDELTHVKIDQVVIGSCTNGRLEDLRTAAAILGGKSVHPEVRLIVVPGSQRVYLKALEEGLITTFVESGGTVTNPTCGPCFGGHLGILASGERALSTTNRNFIGRMGHRTSEVYLSSPAVAAASAVTGRITHPEELR